MFFRNPLNPYPYPDPIDIHTHHNSMNIYGHEHYETADGMIDFYPGEDGEVEVFYHRKQTQEEINEEFRRRHPCPEYVVVPWWDFL